MKKRNVLLLSSFLAATLALGACGGPTSNGESSGTAGGYISVDPLTIDGFNSEFLPDKSKIEQREGQIDVNIIFENTEAGWQALADEYERLHGGAVIVNLDTTLSTEKYKEVLNQQINDPNTKWDIIQGNLVDGGMLPTKGVNMYSEIVKPNAYAANKTWRTVLEREAYVMGMGSDTSTYILNMENLQTAWFVNKTAMGEAGVTKNPETWDELMDLCAKLQAAGYTQPLGISLDSTSVDSNQFTWLVRVYGDYYYRNEYNNIMTNEEYEVDLFKDEDPESGTDFNVVDTKFYNLILDDTNTSGYYVGAKSGKYKEFIEQFLKMKPYLNANVTTASQEELRTQFRTQSKGKDSPQIMLDYAGRGLSFAGSDKIDMDFFDYPVMVSEGGYVAEGTLLRDVGGSGGYISIINHDSKQNKLNLDFIKFVLSPYGQTIYYNALSKTDYSPNGMTTVINDYVIVPQAWKDYFETDKISFTGLSDSNPFVQNFLRYLAMLDGSKTAFKDLWQKYLTGQIVTSDFATGWHNALMSDWTKFANKSNWNVDCYKTWGGPTK